MVVLPYLDFLCYAKEALPWRGSLWCIVGKAPRQQWRPWLRKFMKLFWLVELRGAFGCREERNSERLWGLQRFVAWSVLQRNMLHLSLRFDRVENLNRAGLRTCITFAFSSELNWPGVTLDVNCEYFCKFHQCDDKISSIGMPLLEILQTLKFLKMEFRTR